MGPLEAAVSRDVDVSASQKKGTGFTEPPRGQQHLKTMSLGPHFRGAVGMRVCICFVHTRSNTRCPKDISKGKAIPVQAWTGP